MVEALLPRLELLHSLAHSGGATKAAPAQQLLLLDIIGFLLELSPSRVLAASQPSFAWLLDVYTGMLRWALRSAVPWRVLHLGSPLQASCPNLLGIPSPGMLPGIHTAELDGLCNSMHLCCMTCRWHPVQCSTRCITTALL